MKTVCAIVEGDGEVKALPIVLRRLHERYGPGDYVEVLAPIRVHKDRFLNREFEAWFIAAASSLDGVRGFVWREADRIDAETPRNAKGWLKERMGGRSYGETTDQAAFSARFDLDEAAANSRSFRKMCPEWRKNFQIGADAGVTVA